MHWKQYRKICREAHGAFPPTWHVHHIDGNRANNEASNLIAVPRHVHERIHKLGGTLGIMPSRSIILGMLKVESNEIERFRELRAELNALNKRAKEIRKILRGKRGA